MKKILILFLSITLFTACSDDDDSTNLEGDIVGTWTLVEASNIPGYTVDECTGQSTITFNADNTASSDFFTNNGAECNQDSDTGDWSSSANSQYTFAVPQLGDITGVVSFNDNNTRFVFTPVDFPTSSLTFEK